MTHLRALSPIQRERQAEWMREHHDALVATSAGTAFIVPNMIVRGNKCFMVELASLEFSLHFPILERS